MRRDHIYFCEKYQDVTRLYSLADFKLWEAKGGSKSIWNNASFEVKYIEGQYGAVPYLGDVKTIFESHLRRVKLLKQNDKPQF